MFKKLESPRAFVDLNGYEGFYEISPDGFVRRKSTGRLIRRQVKKSGYSYVCLAVKGRNTYERIHRLVALQFIPNPSNLPQVNHRNGFKLHNNVENLEWVTSSDNLKHAHETGLKMPANCRPVEQVYFSGDVVQKYSSTTSAENDGFNHGCIVMCCQGKRKSHKGFYWRYSGLN